MGEYAVSAGPSVYTYSDMNGYGHFVPALFWSITYWLSIFALLGVISIAYARRGAEDSLGARTRLARRGRPGSRRRRRLLRAGDRCRAGWYYYNAHVLNEF